MYFLVSLAVVCGLTCLCSVTYLVQVETATRGMQTDSDEHRVEVLSQRTDVHTSVAKRELHKPRFLAPLLDVSVGITCRLPLALVYRLFFDMACGVMCRTRHWPCARSSHCAGY